MRILILCFLSFVSCVSWAGGDYVLGKVTGFSEADGVYKFRFTEMPTGRSHLMDGCPVFNVVLEYKRVPWYSWLPGVSTAHPTKIQTQAAIDVLQNAKKTDQLIRFGYMGTGLEPAGKACLFKSRGLKLEIYKAQPVVVSYYNPI